MKKVILTSLSILLLGVMLSNISCEKLEVKRITKLDTGEVLDITHNFANVQGLIIDVSDDVQQIGHCWDTLSNPDINNSKEISTGVYSKGAGIQTAMTNLLAGYTYYVRAYAITSKGQVYGEEISFTTSGQSLITITSPTRTSLWALGSTQQITWTGSIEGSVRIELRQGDNLAELISESAASDTSFPWEIPTAGLSAGTYYVQVSNVNDTGIVGVSEEFEITEATVKDIDDNSYKIVKIGDQWWMAENLKVTRYWDGSAIGVGEITDNTTWANLGDNDTDKAYCYYNNNESDEVATYGALYTWAAAMNGNSSSSANPSGIQGICPAGWHLPSDDEWKELEMHLGMSQTDADGTGWRGTGEGGKLKDTGTIHWISPNTGATNESGFIALPGGFRSYSAGSFVNLNYYGYWLTSTEFDGTSFWYRYLYHDNIDVRRGNFFKSHGFSIRCVKD